MEKILFIRLKSIGDVILTLPAVHALRENFPDAKITCLTSRENASLLRGFRDVDDVIILDREKLRGGNPFATIAEFFGLLRRLRAGHFSLVADFQAYGETAWLTRITGAPRRWSTYFHPNRSWAYTLSRSEDAPLHAADAHLELLRRGGLKLGAIRNQFTLPPDALAAAQVFFRENKIDPARPVLFIQPITSGAHKNWPLENYLAVARHWRDQGMQIIFGGGPDDRAILQPAAAENFCVATGQPLLVTGGLLQLSTFVLGGDTGALHLAVALGKNVLMLMRQSDPGSPIPYQHPDWILVAPGPDRIAEIPVANVNTTLATRLKMP